MTLFFEKNIHPFSSQTTNYPLPLSHTHTHVFPDETRLKGIIFSPHASVATIGVGFLRGGFNSVLQ